MQLIHRANALREAKEKEDESTTQSPHEKSITHFVSYLNYQLTLIPQALWPDFSEEAVKLVNSYVRRGQVPATSTVNDHIVDVVSVSEPTIPPLRQSSPAAGLPQVCAPRQRRRASDTQAMSMVSTSTVPSGSSSLGPLKVLAMPMASDTPPIRTMSAPPGCGSSEQNLDLYSLGLHTLPLGFGMSPAPPSTLSSTKVTNCDGRIGQTPTATVSAQGPSATVTTSSGLLLPSSLYSSVPSPFTPYYHAVPSPYGGLHTPQMLLTPSPAPSTTLVSTRPNPPTPLQNGDHSSEVCVNNYTWGNVIKTLFNVCHETLL